MKESNLNRSSSDPVLRAVQCKVCCKLQSSFNSSKHFYRCQCQLKCQAILRMYPLTHLELQKHLGLRYNTQPKGITLCYTFRILTPFNSTCVLNKSISTIKTTLQKAVEILLQIQKIMLFEVSETLLYRLSFYLLQLCVSFTSYFSIV